MNDVYTENGYADRAEYLSDLSVDYGIELRTVLHLADLLGPDEDFDGLVTTIQDYAS